jgi:hypothetical protein
MVSMEPIAAFECVLARPRMYVDDPQTLREVLLFVSGICWAKQRGPGDRVLDDFPEYVQQRFAQPRNVTWARTLLQEYGDLPLLEGCQEVATILRDWKAMKSQ